MSFQDNFSRQAAEYSRYRPTYPDELFAFLASIAPGDALAWDCATGNGQAARGLIRHFRRVIATDASDRQIAHAPATGGIEYRVMPAEATDIEDASVDLITAAAALHWFDLERFYAEANRVLRPGGVIAAWSYSDSAADPEVQPTLSRYGMEIVGPYWSPSLRNLWDGYGKLPFPFDDITPPPQNVHVEWTLEELRGYLGTWSAVQKFIEVRGYDPFTEIEGELGDIWGDPATRRPIRFPMEVRVGRKRETV